MSMMLRTPPRSLADASNPPGNVEGDGGDGAVLSECQICDKPNDNLMVMCDDCDLWHHYDCVGVTADVATTNVPWACDLCLEKRKRASSKASKASKSSSKRRAIQLQLENLDEERKMEQKRQEEIAQAKAEADKRYLAKKLELLQEQEQLSSDDDIESTDDTIRQARTKDWVRSASDSNMQSRRNVNTATGRAVSATNEQCIFTTTAEVHPTTSNATKVHHPASRSTNIPKTTAKMNQPPANPTNNIPLMSEEVNVNRPMRNAEVTRQTLRRDPHATIAPIFETASERAPSIRSHHSSNASHYSAEEPVARTEPYLSRNQIAARHALPKDLPQFSGKPEEWPIFISSFERSTNACGFLWKRIWSVFKGA